MVLKNAQKKIAKFISERDWDRYHTPKNLMLSLSVEVGELLSLVEWMSDEQVRTALEHQDFNRAVKDELADVFHHFLQLCNKLDVDIIDAFNEKLEDSRLRFPVDKAKKFDPVEWRLKKIREKNKVRL